ncbi:exosortase/archaeosortase family protein [Botrimarina hoheduenensis]|uniref:Transmembrane exosortase n=1 Tax=Botrimarina hoheduenensis TaxID=2528000 RepID=A0A5C5W9G9_9BACT|nr:exosortase/archaeosortase family protein [Botrimarina hoheduenensis]TWT47264.1 Transmembrane exosortase [Botrimarina hoheduenensis]
MAVDFLTPGAMQAPAEEAPTFSWADATQKASYFALVGLSALLVYSYWNMFELTAQVWEKPQYSHGYIIPLIALYLMWFRRPNPVAQEPPRGGQEETFLNLMPASQFRQAIVGGGLVATGIGWWLENHLLEGLGWAILCVGGLAYVLIGQPFFKVSTAARYTGAGILLAGYALRILVAAEYEIEPLNRMSFVVALFGVFLLVGGWRLIAWAGPAVGFLLFMYPLPTMLERPLLGWLQRVAAALSEVVLVILGQPVVRNGSVIIVDGMEMEVAEACSGMRMMTIFLGLAVAMVFLIKRPWWDRFTVLLSAIPIALFVNILRIVVTALLFRVFDSELAHKMVHDFAGFGMMIPALGLLYLEQTVLAKLTVPEEGIEARAIGMGPAPIR